MVTKPTIWPQGRFGVPQITPYTYRDGQTLLELIKAIRDHITDVLYPELDRVIDQLNTITDEHKEHTEAQYQEALKQYHDGIQAFQNIHDLFMGDVNAHLMAMNDQSAANLAADPETRFHQAILDIVRSEMS